MAVTEDEARGGSGGTGTPAPGVRKEILVAFTGNPNSGKTTFFNTLTGARQHVGNYPGVTVEKKEGTCRQGGRTFRIVDLPGTYSLTAFSVEEVVARNFIIEEKPDVVVDILDASNLERNLYLAVQLMELGAPLVLALNMSDVAEARGIDFDLARLSTLFQAPIVPTVGTKGYGAEELLRTVGQVADGTWNLGGKRPGQIKVNYGTAMEEIIRELEVLIERDRAPEARKYGARWLAVKALEEDKEVRKLVATPELAAALKKGGERIEARDGDPPTIVISDRRYGLISGACQEAVKVTAELRHSTSDLIDKVMTNRLLGFPLFLGMMYLVFQLTFALGEPAMGWIESFFSLLGSTLSTLWPKSTYSPLKSLLVDGIIGGVGGVLVFLPNILLLFLAIALLEDTGYMARAAFIMDRLMHKIGLHGKSFIPLIIGFGCSVPAIMATRTLSSRSDRLTTMLVAPLISCGARLPIYALIIPAFFPAGQQASMLMLIYCIGIMLAIVCAKILRNTLFRGESTPFIMELPPYRIPTPRSILIHMGERSWMYLKKAGTVILGISILLWAMTSYPKKPVFDRDYEGEARQARSDYLAGVALVSRDLGMVPEQDFLTQAVQAELAMATEQESYYEHETGYGAAIEKKDALVKQLGEAPAGGLLAGFLEMRDRIDKIYRDFDEAVAAGRGTPGSREYQELEISRDHRISYLEGKPGFAAAVKYRDQVRGPYEEKLAEVEKSRQTESLAYSLTGRLGQTIAPLIRPLGFDWKIGTSLVGALAAKEVFVAQMGIVYSVGEADEGSEALRSQLRKNYTPLVAFCIMLFCLVSAPCMATIAVTGRESGSWKWSVFQFGSLTIIAYTLTFLVYQAGSLLKIGVG